MVRCKSKSLKGLENFNYFLNQWSGSLRNLVLLEVWILRVSEKSWQKKLLTTALTAGYDDDDYRRLYINLKLFMIGNKII